MIAGHASSIYCLYWVHIKMLVHGYDVGAPKRGLAVTEPIAVHVEAMAAVSVPAT